MIKLKNILNELKILSVNDIKIPEGWRKFTEEDVIYYNEDEDIYDPNNTNGGEVINGYDALMKGWDKKHKDVIIIVKTLDNKFIINVYVAFGGRNILGVLDYKDLIFNSYNESLVKAIKIMKDINIDNNFEDLEKETNKNLKDIKNIKQKYKTK